MNTNDLGSLQFPRQIGHDVHSIGTTHADGRHTETACIGSMRVGTDEQSAREAVIFKDYLVYY